MSRWSTLLLALPMLVLGCGAREESQTSTSEPSVSAQERTEYEGTAERRLSELGARIDSLKTELDVASAQTKAEIQTQIDELEIKRQEASRKLAELRAAGADRWGQMRNEVANMLDDLDQRFDRMRARLREDRG